MIGFIEILNKEGDWCYSLSAEVGLMRLPAPHGEGIAFISKRPLLTEYKAQSPITECHYLIKETAGTMKTFFFYFYFKAIHIFFFPLIIKKQNKI